MAVESKNIRNVILLGHQESGKTSIVEQLLFNGGTITKAGSVDTSNTVSDYNEDEIERKISVNSSISSFTHNGIKVNLIDTPGFSEFVGEVIGGLRAADAAVLVVNAVSGIQIGTDTVYKLMKQKGLPFAVFVNRMDKDHADFAKCMEQIVRKYGKGAVCVASPIGSQASFKGVVNLLTGEGLDSLEEAEKAKTKALCDSLSESVAESDDALLEKYLEKGELSADEIRSAYRQAVLGGKVVPVIAGSAAHNIGIKELMAVIENAFPSPLDGMPVQATDLSNNEKTDIEAKADASFAAQIFKTISDPYLGQISIMKVFSGSITSNSNAQNSTQGIKEKVGQLFFLNGKKEVQTDAVTAGDIGCMAKLKGTLTGDTLTDEKRQVCFDKIAFPEPAIAFSIKPKTRSDEDKISNALHKLTAEDNTFTINRDAQTRELIASGMGDFHLNIMINRLRNRYGVQVDIGTPKVAYKETITGQGGSQYRHKKQSGGAGQFAEVWMRVEPLDRGAGFEFVDEVVGGAIPAQFVASCEKGVRAALDSGFLAGFPVVDVRVIVYDGKTHPVDSKDIAFQIAARHAFKESCLKAKPAILEPIMDVDIIVPEEYMGDITGSLNQRRGRVLGMEAGEGMQTIKAQVPLDEMYKYVNELKSITAGRGVYTMKYSHYEMVPSNIVQGIIANAKTAKEEETE
ncbi:MAG: elongation factor G [Candidatus Omnitrophota bacterium]